ncbi:MAG: hypothetical protein R3195_02240 [Gemmatimonadota bacterium]|nr:hypothetical protein [Gemmatimonadota bacterium]
MSEPSTLLEQGHRARRAGRPGEALRRFEDAARAARAGGGRDLVKSLMGVGQIHRDVGDPSAARAPYEEAVGVCRGLDDPLFLAHTVRHLADLHLSEDRLEAAEPLYAEALALYREHGTDARAGDVANALRPYAILRERAGDTASAIRFWEEAKASYAAADMQAGVDEADEHLGRLGAA